MLHYLWSADILKSLSQLICQYLSFLNIFFQKTLKSINRLDFDWLPHGLLKIRPFMSHFRKNHKRPVFQMQD